ncbi:Phosphatidylinositol transfer protein SFH5 [Hondaea fermentalgiana]|uniref:Phosphatidylinositol transfer protein SFH5 n=1 Tax=Hondaea fermentalgiana TaxID=2315210 RepID=A0A2R5G5P1_9STRA|nr:Phosphatidylinositol transfer protein SFH5 [Hondaea fermentalgiana]|eukprot:GBG26357.1 Phosphatidylinositol transfer protein SFH5 [Hondaea fermentalgiana]
MEASRPRQPEPGAAAAEKETSVPTSVQNFLVKLGPLRDAVHGDEALRAKLQLGAESEDAFLSRFIIATNGDVNAAVKQIREFVACPLDAQYTVVMDFEGASMSQLKKPFTSIIKKTMHIDQTFYPERMFRSVLINVPLLFSACWSIVKNFLDKDTLTKLRIVRSDYFKYLEEIIDPAQIPSDFGGKAPKLSYEDHMLQQLKIMA